jgi:hypothetical protein
MCFESASIPFFTAGDKAILNPVIIIKTICMAKLIKSKNPWYQDLMISKRLASSQI